MKNPTVSVIMAAHTVDYLSHAYIWTEIDIVYAYVEVKKELAAFRSKCREKHEKPLKKLQLEEWLKEKRLLRQENSLWRRMGVVKSGRLVALRALNCNLL
ncbi:7105_t:CDS:1 [Ambispora gerdemannii]|uniref:7105_t:CDS:1 n=1 Tax=Ambispora gerdemannii TaxID=144530 RepID=A0A9N9CAD2_9GLOM|nr:7105_t:CDS:1 [Ambispora gerdemannii]